MLLIFKIYVYNSGRSESLISKFLIREITEVKNIEEQFSINKKKNKYVQGQMVAGWKFFEDQNLTFCLIQPFSGGEKGLGGGSKQKELVFR